MLGAGEVGAPGFLMGEGIDGLSTCFLSASRGHIFAFAGKRRVVCGCRFLLGASAHDNRVCCSSVHDKLNCCSYFSFCEQQMGLVAHE